MRLSEKLIVSEFYFFENTWKYNIILITLNYKVLFNNLNSTV